MKTDFIKITKGITQIIEIWEPKLTSLEKEVITERRNKQNRNIMQILGHLVDSASNNHQRMVRLQYNKFKFRKFTLPVLICKYHIYDSSLQTC